MVFGLNKAERVVDEGNAVVLSEDLCGLLEEKIGLGVQFSNGLSKLADADSGRDGDVAIPG
jgi:hypothetical protein